MLLRVVSILGLLALVAKAQRQVCVIDVALVIDHSGSIKDNDVPGKPKNWDTLKEFLRTIVRSLDIAPASTRMASVMYGNKATINFDFNEGSSSDFIFKNIDDMQNKGGNTNTTGGLRAMRTLMEDPTKGNRDFVRDILILITDGKPTREAAGLMAEVRAVKAAGTRLIGVGITALVNRTQMLEIVDRPSDYFTADDFSKLSSILDQLIQEACRTLEPTTPRPTTTTTAPAMPCEQPGDFVFVLDASGSIQQKNFDIMKQFVKAVITDMAIGSNQVRVGILVFSTDAKIEFQLNKYTRKADVLTAVDAITYTRGTTNTAAALRSVHSTMFTSGNGDRPDRPNIVCILTDGGSNKKQDTLEEAYQAKKKGIHILVIGLGNWVDRYELESMASYPYDKNKVDVTNFNQLIPMKQQIIDMVCNNGRECNSRPCQNGGTCIDGVLHYVCLCRSGFAGVNCESTCREKSDVTFLLDGSGSIGSPNFRKELDFVRDIVIGLNLNVDSRVAMETYSTTPKARFYLDDYNNKMDVLNAMTFYYEGGTTNTAAALIMSKDEIFTSNKGDRREVQNVAVVITDGRSNNESATWQQARLLREDDTHIIAVGVGNNVHPIELETMASYPSRTNVLRVTDFDSFQGRTSDLIDLVCNNKDDCSPNPCRNGQCIDQIGGYTCECRTGWSGTNCDKGCDSKMDIGIILDASGSIRNERFPKVLEFVNTLIEEFNIGESSTRIASVRWSDDAAVNFNLNSYKYKGDVMSAVKHIKFMGGRTKTASALTMMRTNMFTSRFGDRDDAPNVAIIFTDGNSNIDEDKTIPEAILARINGMETIVVAVGTDLNMLELRGIATEPMPSHLFSVASWRDLNSIKDPIMAATCNDKNECSSNPCQNRGRCLDLLNRYVCDCQSDYTGRNCERRCTRQMDVVFIIDLSGSMDVVYDISIAYVTEVIHGLHLHSDRVRVGLVSYADQSKVNFYLNTYQSKTEVLNALSFRIAGGRTNTQSALNMMRQDVFSSRGERSGVPNVAIVLSDGESNIQETNTIPMADQAKRGNIEIFAVAVGAQVDMREVNAIASDPDSEHVYTVPTPNDVTSEAEKLLDRLCQ